MKDAIIPDQPAFYEVITDAFIYEGRVYTRGELIPRERVELDYSLGSGLIRLYQPEGMKTTPPRETLGSRIANFVTRRSSRAN